MAYIIRMPKLSDTMEEGGISSWLKKEGDVVEEGAALVAIETDKATMEYMSPEEGTLLKILVKKGESCPLQAPIAVIGKAGEKFDLAALLGAVSPTSSPSVSSAKAPEKVASPKAQVEVVATVANVLGRIKASPLAKKIAQQNNIRLDQLQGSGPMGRIVVRDLNGVKSGSTSASFAKPRKLSAPVQTPHTQMRKAIAKRLVAAKNEAPHFYLTTTLRADALMKWRGILNKSSAVLNTKAKISINDLLVFTVARALTYHPTVNSSWGETAITTMPASDIAIAVAVPSGLITPIIWNADQMSVLDISNKTKELAERAKAGGLKPEEYQGGTFTISNLGMTCVDQFTSIINPPHACILAVGRIRKTPVVNDDNTIVVGHEMTITLSCDHRVVDGMVGALFLGTVKEFLEEPMVMFSV